MGLLQFLFLFLIFLPGKGFARNAPPFPEPNVSTPGGGFQVFFGKGGGRHTIQIQNNGVGADNCWVLIAGPWVAGDLLATTRAVGQNPVTLTAQQGAILLTPGGSLGRYTLVPNDQVLFTCATTADSIYAD